MGMMSRAEAAKHLGVSIVTVDRARASMRLPYVRLGRRILFRPEDLELFVRSKLASRIQRRKPC